MFFPQHKKTSNQRQQLNKKTLLRTFTFLSFLYFVNLTGDTTMQFLEFQVYVIAYCMYNSAGPVCQILTPFGQLRKDFSMLPLTCKAVPLGNGCPLVSPIQQRSKEIWKHYITLFVFHTLKERVVFIQLKQVVLCNALTPHQN